ncbi:hypothetical protein [Streptomyces werraensis]|uniref:hypothetical protein n=1 Tax=Streptomyces werraensis TaxID=68284 RepID=UPI0037CFFE38
MEQPLETAETNRTNAAAASCWSVTACRCRAAAHKSFRLVKADDRSAWQDMMASQVTPLQVRRPRTVADTRLTPYRERDALAVGDDVVLAARSTGQGALWAPACGPDVTSRLLLRAAG